MLEVDGIHCVYDGVPLVEINRQGTTILLVEQMVQEALEIANRAYVLQTGRIVQEGLAKDLLASDSVRKAYIGL
jgi:branched-chain amino acid transport system ATP-binding protein